MHRSRKHGLRVLLIGGALLSVVCAVSAATWVQDGRPNDPKAPKELNCTPIDGTVGKIGPWGRTEAGSSKSQLHEGMYGGHWDGARYDICNLQSESQDDTLEHKYRKIGGASNRWLRIEAWSTPEFSGSSEEHTPSVPVSWWWNCSCVVTQDEPKATYKTSSTGNPITISVEEFKNTPGKADGGQFGPTDPVTQPPATPTPPPATYPVPAGTAHQPPNKPKPPDPLAPAPVTNPTAQVNYPKSKGGYKNNDPHDAPLGGGSYWARSPQKIPTSAVSISVTMKVHAAASIDADNAKVHDWEVALMIHFESELHNSKPPNP